MLSDGKSQEAVKSPLHRLQSAIVNDLPFRQTREPEQNHPHNAFSARRTPELNHNFDSESVYSFDSVLTNGRLLDRLDLESEEFCDDDDFIRRRESFASVQSTGRLLDRLGLDDNSDEQVLLPPLRLKPILANSSSSLERMKTSASMGTPVRALSNSGRMPLKLAPYKVALQRGSLSVDSLQGDIASRGSSTSLVSLLDSGSGSGSSGLALHAPMRLGSSRSKSFPSESSIKETDGELASGLHSSNLSLPTINGSAQRYQQLPPLPTRNLSASSVGSATSVDSSSPVFNPNAKFDPSLEVFTKKAMQLRLQGNHREASYQLQISASPPHNYPKAMYLYARALLLGQGVKLNEILAIKWLCRCVLVSYIIEAAPLDGQNLTNYVSRLIELQPLDLLNLVKTNVAQEDLDPFRLYEKFQLFQPATLSRISANNQKDGNTVGGAYFELGKCLIAGQGSVRDDVTGRLFLAKSASLCYGDAMVLLGELWSSKSKHFKKDLTIAAVWLRLGELFGKKDIGNSWIYKEKYMERKQKK